MGALCTYRTLFGHKGCHTCAGEPPCAFEGLAQRSGALLGSGTVHRVTDTAARPRQMWPLPLPLECICSSGPYLSLESSAACVRCDMSACAAAEQHARLSAPRHIGCFSRDACARRDSAYLCSTSHKRCVGSAAPRALSTRCGTRTSRECSMPLCARRCVCSQERPV